MTRTKPTSASRKVPLAPDLTSLEDRSARAWTEPMAVRPLGDGRYVVESGSGGTYVVDLDRGRCSCPDHEIRGARCKHMRRVAIEITEGRVPTPREQDRSAPPHSSPPDRNA